MSESTASPDQRRALISLYDRALPDVYGYLASRCGSASVAEDLTSETFLAAVNAVRRGTVPDLTVASLIGVARHKLVDHWRRQGRERTEEATSEVSADDWDAQLDQLAAPLEPQTPRPSFARALRAQLVDALGLDPLAAVSTGAIPRRKTMTAGPILERGPRAGQQYVDGIWAVVSYHDPDAGIRFVREVLGFDELVLVHDSDGKIAHSEYRWPEGGIVQVAEWDEANPFLAPPGQIGLYVVTQDPQAVWVRCQAAGVEVLRPPQEPHHDPGSMGFSIRDPEGNAWSFGSYAGGATE